MSFWCANSGWMLNGNKNVISRTKSLKSRDNTFFMRCTRTINARFKPSCLEIVSIRSRFKPSCLVLVLCMEELLGWATKEYLQTLSWGFIWRPKARLDMRIHFDEVCSNVYDVHRARWAIGIVIKCIRYRLVMRAAKKAGARLDYRFFNLSNKLRSKYRIYSSILWISSSISYA